MLQDGDMFMIGYSAVLVDQDGYITIRAKAFRGSVCLWELLIRKRVNKEHVTSDVLITYKRILLMHNAHLEGYQPVINQSLMSSEGNLSAKLLPSFRESHRLRCRIWFTLRFRKY